MIVKPETNDTPESAPPDQEPIRLNFEDGGRQVVVCPSDQDRFVTTSEQAAEACQQALNMKQWREQFHKMLFQLRQWAEGSAVGVQFCFVAVREGQLVVFAASKAGKYSFEFADELTDIDLRIASNFPLVRCEVMQVPFDADRVAAFLNPSEALLIYGDIGRTQR